MSDARIGCLIALATVLVSVFLLLLVLLGLVELVSWIL